MKIPVVFSTDHGYVMPTGVAIMSMLKVSDDCEFDIRILHDDSVTETDKQTLNKIVSSAKPLSQISFVPMGSMFVGSYEPRGIKHPAYYRLMIPWLFPDLDKVLYFDGDVIFIRSIKPLYEFYLGNNYCSGLKRFQYDGKTFGKYAKKIGVDPNGYINSGVMSFNSKLIRDENLKEQFVFYSRKKLRYQDQDIINIVCKNRIASIPFGFNVTSSMDIPEDEMYIIHYTGLKPWKSFVRYWYEWWEVYRQSPFYDRKLDKYIAETPMGVKLHIKLYVKRRMPKFYQFLKEMFSHIFI